MTSSYLVKSTNSGSLGELKMQLINAIQHPLCLLHSKHIYTNVIIIIIIIVVVIITLLLRHITLHVSKF